MFCATCGAVAQAGQRFCGSCGTALAATPPPPPSPAPPPSVADAAMTTPLTVVEQTVPTYQPTPAAWDPTQGGAWSIGATHDAPEAPWPTGEQPALAPIPAPTGSAALVVVLAFFTAVAAVVGSVLTTYRLDVGSSQRFTPDDLFGNVRVGLILGAVVMLIGLVLSATGRREGVGIAGGAGVAIASLTMLVIASVMVTFDMFRDGLLGQGAFTHEPGFFVLVGAGGLGLLTFLVSLSSSGFDGRLAVHPAIATAGVVATLLVVIGPLVPVNGLTWRDNVDELLSPWLVWLRLASLAVIAIGCLSGFLSRRRWGLAVALATISVPAWQWFTTLTSPSSGDDRNPLGIAIANVGSTDGAPHALTTIGVVGVVCAVIAGAGIEAARTGATDTWNSGGAR